jgi:hypothetical protein
MDFLRGQMLNDYEGNKTFEDQTKINLKNLGVTDPGSKPGSPSSYQTSPHHMPFYFKSLESCPVMAILF